jgi:two-component system LytT family response regulator
MGILRVLIADDELLARERLRHLLQEEKDVEIVAECASGIETIQAIRDHTPDIVFLDVRMPGLDGFGVIEKLGKVSLPIFIFVTAHEEFALRAFAASAVDYLLKPFDRQRLHKALLRARETVNQRRDHQGMGEIARLLAGLKTRPKPVQRFAVRSQGRVVFVETGRIDWIRGADNYSELHVGESTHLLRQTLASLERDLPENQFIRISRSLIVNLDSVREFRSSSHGDFHVLLHDGTRLSASRNYRERLRRLMDKDR